MSTYDDSYDFWVQFWTWVKYLYYDLRVYLGIIFLIYSGDAQEWYQYIRRDWNNLTALIWNLVIHWYNKVVTFINEIYAYFADARSWVIEFGNIVWDWILTKSSTVWTWIQVLRNTIYNDLRLYYTTIWQWIRDHAIYIWDWVRTTGATTAAWVVVKGGTVWDWIFNKATIVWDWVYGWSGYITNWVYLTGHIIQLWFNDVQENLNRWLMYYYAYYVTLFTDHGNRLLDILASPGEEIGKFTTLDIVEKWLYNRWFKQN